LSNENSTLYISLLSSAVIVLILLFMMIYFFRKKKGGFPNNDINSERKDEEYKSIKGEKF
jgi:hypothetical protein